MFRGVWVIEKNPFPSSTVIRVTKGAPTFKAIGLDERPLLDQHRLPLLLCPEHDPDLLDVLNMPVELRDLIELQLIRVVLLLRGWDVDLDVRQCDDLLLDLLVKLLRQVEERGKVAPNDVEELVVFVAEEGGPSDLVPRFPGEEPVRELGRFLVGAAIDSVDNHEPVEAHLPTEIDQLAIPNEEIIQCVVKLSSLAEGVYLIH